MIRITRRTRRGLRELSTARGFRSNTAGQGGFNYLAIELDDGSLLMIELETQEEARQLLSHAAILHSRLTS